MHRKLDRKTGDHSGPRGLCRIREKVTERKDSKYKGKRWKGGTAEDVQKRHLAPKVSCVVHEYFDSLEHQFSIHTAQGVSSQVAGCMILLDYTGSVHHSGNL